MLHLTHTADGRDGRDPWNRAARILAAALPTLAVLAAAGAAPAAVPGPVYPGPGFPEVRGAAVQPSTMVRVHRGEPVDVLTCPTAEGRPSDVSIVRANGRQYATTADGRTWTHRGRIVAIRQGPIVLTARTAYVATWCE